jgi:hypothetical protein
MTHEIAEERSEDGRAVADDGDLRAAAMENDRPLEEMAAIGDKLLSRSKVRIDKGWRSIRDGVEDFAVAKERCNATQREIAGRLGKAESWVSRMLKWREEGYPDTPFGPESKAARERRMRLQATEVCAQSPKAEAPTVDGVTPNTTPIMPNAAAVAETMPTTATDIANRDSKKVRNSKANAATSRAIKVTAPSAATKGPSPDEAKNNLIYALDHWWPYIDEAGKAEVVDRFFKLKGLRLS